MVRWLIGLSLLASSLSFGILIEKASAAQTPDQYYTVRDPLSARAEFSFTPLTSFADLKDAAVAEVNLLDFEAHADTFAAPSEPYNRLRDFGAWKSQGDCHDTRTYVLMRDSTTPVDFKENNHCKVATGTWVDPYTGRTFTSPTDVQIDHVVPLKHAYLSGAWKWGGNLRCLYANFVENNFHLLAVSGHENQSKGDRSPAGYMPPDQGFSCQYVKIWLQIKLIWKLILSPEEAAAIDQLVKEHGCRGPALRSSLRELTEQRRQIYNNQDFCTP